MIAPSAVGRTSTYYEHVGPISTMFIIEGGCYAPSSSQDPSICASGCSQGYPVIIFIISICSILKRTVRTHGLRGEDGTLGQLLVRERVALLLFCSEFVQHSTGSITHADEQPLEVVGIVRGPGVDSRWETQRARVTRSLRRAALARANVAQNCQSHVRHFPSAITAR